MKTNTDPAALVRESLVAQGIPGDDSLVTKIVAKVGAQLIVDSVNMDTGLLPSFVKDAVSAMKSELTSPPQTLHDKALAKVDETYGRNISAQDRLRYHTALLAKMTREANAQTATERAMKDLAVKDSHDATDLLRVANSLHADKAREQNTQGKRVNSAAAIDPADLPEGFEKMSALQRLNFVNHLTSNDVVMLKRSLARDLAHQEHVNKHGDESDRRVLAQRIETTRRRLQQHGIKTS